jgi:2-polyprenyl-3-methyl-5-hydroxy-6-metoxy-1,4-benzoquinol methylase
VTAVPDDQQDLHQRRVDASAQSRGISADPIYVAIERRLEDLGAAGDLLDFGAGTGGLTSRLRASGRFRSITGADLFARADTMPADVAWLEVDLNGRLPVADGSFDVIVAAEVIEHLENPRAICRELFRLLRPGGHVLLTTPNNESWRSLVALVFRGHFVAFGDSSYPAHITALVRQDLDRALAEAGFGPRSFAFTNVGGIPGLPARTWQSFLGPRAGGLRFSDNVLVNARKA